MNIINYYKMNIKIPDNNNQACNKNSPFSKKDNDRTEIPLFNNLSINSFSQEVEYLRNDYDGLKNRLMIKFKQENFNKYPANLNNKNSIQAIVSNNWDISNQEYNKEMNIHNNTSHRNNLHKIRENFPNISYCNSKQIEKIMNRNSLDSPLNKIKSSSKTEDYSNLYKVNYSDNNESFALLKSYKNSSDKNKNHRSRSNSIKKTTKITNDRIIQIKKNLLFENSDPHYNNLYMKNSNICFSPTYSNTSYKENIMNQRMRNDSNNLNLQENERIKLINNNMYLYNQLINNPAPKFKKLFNNNKNNGLNININNSNIRNTINTNHTGNTIYNSNTILKTNSLDYINKIGSECDTQINDNKKIIINKMDIEQQSINNEVLINNTVNELFGIDGTHLPSKTNNSHNSLNIKNYKKEKLAISLFSNNNCKFGFHLTCLTNNIPLTNFVNKEKSNAMLYIQTGISAENFYNVFTEDKLNYIFDDKTNISEYVCISSEDSNNGNNSNNNNNSSSKDIEKNYILNKLRSKAIYICTNTLLPYCYFLLFDPIIIKSSFTKKDETDISFNNNSDINININSSNNNNNNSSNTIKYKKALRLLILEKNLFLNEFNRLTKYCQTMNSFNKNKYDTNKIIDITQKASLDIIDDLQDELFSCFTNNVDTLTVNLLKVFNQNKEIASKNAECLIKSFVSECWCNMKVFFQEKSKDEDIKRKLTSEKFLLSNMIGDIQNKYDEERNFLIGKLKEKERREVNYYNNIRYINKPQNDNNEDDIEGKDRDDKKESERNNVLDKTTIYNAYDNSNNKVHISDDRINDFNNIKFEDEIRDKESNSSSLFQSNSYSNSLSKTNNKEKDRNITNRKNNIDDDMSINNNHNYNEVRYSDRLLFKKLNKLTETKNNSNIEEDNEIKKTKKDKENKIINDSEGIEEASHDKENGYIDLEISVESDNELLSIKENKEAINNDINNNDNKKDSDKDIRNKSKYNIAKNCESPKPSYYYRHNIPNSSKEKNRTYLKSKQSAYMPILKKKNENKLNEINKDNSNSFIDDSINSNTRNDKDSNKANNGAKGAKNQNVVYPMLNTKYETASSYVDKFINNGYYQYLNDYNQYENKISNNKRINRISKFENIDNDIDKRRSKRLLEKTTQVNEEIKENVEDKENNKKEYDNDMKIIKEIYSVARSNLLNRKRKKSDIAHNEQPNLPVFRLKRKYIKKKSITNNTELLLKEDLPVKRKYKKRNKTEITNYNANKKTKDNKKDKKDIKYKKEKKNKKDNKDNKDKNEKKVKRKYIKKRDSIIIDANKQDHVVVSELDSIKANKNDQSDFNKIDTIIYSRNKLTGKSNDSSDTSGNKYECNYYNDDVIHSSTTLKNTYDGDYDYYKRSKTEIIKNKNNIIDNKNKEDLDISRLKDKLPLSSIQDEILQNENYSKDSISNNKRNNMLKDNKNDKEIKENLYINNDNNKNETNSNNIIENTTVSNIILEESNDSSDNTLDKKINIEANKSNVSDLHLCIICMDNLREIMFNKCKHLVYCKECFDLAQNKSTVQSKTRRKNCKCPICFQISKDYLEVKIS